MTSFFGSIRSLFKAKEKAGQPTRISKYEDEIRLLLDTVVLANPSVLAGGFTLFGPAPSSAPTLQEAQRGGKISIKSLCELLIGMTYMTEKGTIVLRVNVNDVVVGGGKIQLPVLIDDWVNSKNVSQYCMRGSLHPDTLVIAVENFTQKRLKDGMLIYEQSKKVGKMIFDFAQIQPGMVYATGEDHIMLERASEPPYINFTFGRNLYWYHKKKNYVVPESSNLDSNRVTASISGAADGSSVKSKSNQTGLQDENTDPTFMSRGELIHTNQTEMPAIHVVGGVPLPPPVPMALRSNNGMPPGTPPPLPMTPMGKKRRKVRQLYWTKVPQNQLNGTIWKERGSPSKLAIDIDQQELEDMFSLSPMKDANGNPILDKLSQAAKNENKGSKADLHPLLDLKRSNNGAVLLSQFKKMKYSDIREALLTMDAKKKFSIENLISLKYMFPLSDQEKKDFLEFKGDISMYGPAERFYWLTLDVPKPEARIQALIFQMQFSEILSNLENAIQVFKIGSDELIQSDKLAEVLILILQLGRALNGAAGSNSVGGFKLDSLSKLADTKAKDKKTSVLDYLVTVAMKQKSSLLEFWMDLPTLELVSRLATETLVEGLKEVKESLDALKLEFDMISVTNTPEREKNVKLAMQELDHFTKCTAADGSCDGTHYDTINTGDENSPDCSSLTTSDGEMDKRPIRFDAQTHFLAAMVPFYEKASQAFMQTKKKHEAAIQAYEKAVRYFCEDPKSTTPSSFFALITSFIDSWKASKAKIDKIAADKVKQELKAKKDAEKAEEKLKKKQPENKENLASTDQDEEEKHDEAEPSTTIDSGDSHTTTDYQVTIFAEKDSVQSLEGSSSQQVSGADAVFDADQVNTSVTIDSEAFESLEKVIPEVIICSTPNKSDERTYRTTSLLDLFSPIKTPSNFVVLEKDNQDFASEPDLIVVEATESMEEVCLEPVQLAY